MTELRSELLGLVPERMESLPLDHRGYPVPWFVAWLVPGESGPESERPRGHEHGGVPDFRVLNSTAVRDALQGNRCWLCGKTMGSFKSYVIGPMCAVNRNSAEPPSHHDCARFAATICPFLARPKAKRREANMPETGEPPGMMIDRNPGACAVWTIKGAVQVRQAPNGTLFDIGTPHQVEWYAEGKPATREQVWESIDSGLPILREMAEAEGHYSVKSLEKKVNQAKVLLPL